MDNLHDKSQGNYKPIPLNGSRPPLPDDRWPYHNLPNNGFDQQYGIKNPKFYRHLFISRNTIMFAVDSQIQMVAKARRTDDGREDDRLTNATTEFKDMFISWFNTHVGKAKTKLEAFVLEHYKTSNMNNIKDVEEIDIELLMPHWWDDTIFDQLTSAVNDYIVNAILQEYFTLVLTSKDPVTIDKATLAADALSDIKKLANASKPGTIRKHLAPF
jgi:hypothetical protein